MNCISMIRAATLALLTICVSAVAGAAPARAEQSSQTTSLCSGAKVCSLTTDRWLREGTTPRVIIRGNPNVRGTVRIFRASVSDNELSGLTPIGKGASFYTDAHGMAQVYVPIPSSSDIGEGGWALVSVSDIEGLDTTRMPGQFVAFGSLVPHLLGDGYSERKPAGQTLDMQAVGAIPGDTYRVQVKQGDTWHDATAIGQLPAAAVNPSQITHIHWTVPRGLTGTKHDVRVQSLTDPRRTASWVLIPTVDGVKAARSPLFTPPPVGTNLGVPTTDRGAHPETAVKAVSGTLFGVGVVSALVVTGASRPKRSSSEPSRDNRTPSSPEASAS
ncbi:hypothetical protein O6R08_08315 [Cutibacterium equinum]|uniref:Uncharacterized protein n=1 Tax=Cutibacterium equinum TaxID=3016342 RepID=A0ABY7QWS7_9ACTN|nr:hypothetical protein [Cutibacterium equinum]WCC79511.1 hypothetical protein O6R08_08315 [Cutibacterium equinum]